MTGACSMTGAETYVERVPAPVLAGRVRTVWVQRTGPLPYLQRNLPTGGVELQCPIGGSPRLVGPLTGPSAQVLPAHTTVVGVRFRPGAAAPLLGLPVDHLPDRTVQLADVWGGAATRLGDLLADAPEPEAALDLLQRYLVSRQERTDRPDPLVTVAVQRLMPWHTVEIGTLTTQLAISASQLRRRFLTTVGVSPKVLQRTLRFQGYLALAQAAARRSRTDGRVADLAAEVGYADHAHLALECLRLTGATPRELLGRSSERCGCEHDHAASYRPFLAVRAQPVLAR